MANILVDTNILINFSKNRNNLLVGYFKKNNTNLFINPIIITEFTNDKNLLKNKNKNQQAIDFLNLFQHLDINKEIAYKTGELIRTNKADYMADAFIAATCLVHNLKLLTHNQKHFKKIPNLTLLP